MGVDGHHRGFDHLAMRVAATHHVQPGLARRGAAAFMPDLAGDQINFFFGRLMIFRQTPYQKTMKGVAGIRLNSVHGGILSMAPIFIGYRNGNCPIRVAASMKGVRGNAPRNARKWRER
ncbi:hypothetical protein [Sphingobium sp. CAP-1]|uniref:hypothetical protein n=1 Tax=Sphingobium sp. CAP-1 TaxID=2676077 RepID=UPI0012BB35EA|nr:hypothetical protein [Sphingobium sp. CAP-1]QGP77968.1 hypothetical protein GL174_02330 [Sphingobium sp. CAP-1]